MHIQINLDTDLLNDGDRHILSALAGAPVAPKMVTVMRGGQEQRVMAEEFNAMSEGQLPVSAGPAEPERAAQEEEAPKPVRRRRAPAKPKVEAPAEPEAPEPAQEEQADAGEDLIGDTEADLKAKAIKAAQDLLSKGDTKSLRAALAEANCDRVTNLKGTEQIEAFLSALAG